MDAVLHDNVGPKGSSAPPQGQGNPIVTEALETNGALDFRIIELFFFAYREFTGDADVVLERYGFGRAHHRVLHFVNRSPGMTIADLLDLLQITKQSLSRVLRQLVDGGFISPLPGEEDRRQRRLYPTLQGRELTLELSRAQAARIESALAKGSGSASDHPAEADYESSVTSFLREMAGDRLQTRAWFRKQGIEEENH